MTEPHPETWSVPQAKPLWAVAGTLTVLVVLLLVAGRIYDKRLRPQRRQPVATFPAPGIETYVHDGTADPYRPMTPPRPDPAVEAAKHQVAAEGLPGWTSRR